jgi:hypothetical protein
MGFALSQHIASSHNAIDRIAWTVRREDDLAMFRALDLLAFVVIAVVFIVWTHRVYRNLVRLGAGHRHSTGWAIGAWITPIVSFWWPKQIVEDVWRGTAPAGEPAYARGGLIDAWWTVYVSAGLVRLFIGNGEGAGAVAWDAVPESLLTVAGILAFWVVTRVTERQEAFVRPASSRHRGDWGPSSDEADAPSARLQKLRWVLPVLGLLGFAIGWLLVASSSVRADQAGALGVPRFDAGDCIEFTDGPESADWETVNCDAPHDAEVYVARDRDDGVGAPYPGDEAIDRETANRCDTDFPTFVGASDFESDLDYVYLRPSEVTWLLGDRQELCAVMRVDGGPMVGTARESGL